MALLYINKLTKQTCSGRHGVRVSTIITDRNALYRQFNSKVYIDLYSALRKAPLMRSDMDHTVLPANYTVPDFTPQPAAEHHRPLAGTHFTDPRRVEG